MNCEKITVLLKRVIEKKAALFYLYAADGRTGHATDGNKYYAEQLEAEIKEIENKIRKEVNDAND